MTEAVNPTNEQIAKMLNEILHRLSELKSDQEQLSVNVGKLAQALER
jgi:hypothetical protein